MVFFVPSIATKSAYDGPNMGPTQRQDRLKIGPKGKTLPKCRLQICSLSHQHIYIYINLSMPTQSYFKPFEGETMQPKNLERQQNEGVCPCMCVMVAPMPKQCGTSVQCLLVLCCDRWDALHCQNSRVSPLWVYLIALMCVCVCTAITQGFMIDDFFIYEARGHDSIHQSVANATDVWRRYAV